MATFGTVDYDPDAAGGGSGITSLTGDVTGTGPGATAATIAAGVVTEAMQVLADNTTNNVSITKHGYVPKAPNDAAKFLDGTGAFSVPAGAGDMVLASVQTVTGKKTFGTAGGAVDKLAVAGATSGSTIVAAKPVAGAGTVTLPASGTLYGTEAGSITSAELAASLTDETGTGVAVFATSPTLVTPVLGVAAATTVNKVSITAPATAATLTIPDGVTLTGPAASGTAMTLGNAEVVTGLKTFGTAGGAVSKLAIAGATSGSTILDATAVAGAGTVTLPTSGTLYGTATGSITSAQLAGSLTDETGTGVAVFATTPTLVTPVLGVATATSVNKVAITAPATSATLTIPDGVTLTGPAASGTAMTLGNTEVVTGAKTFGTAGGAVSKLIVAGATSGSTVIDATAVAGAGTVTLPTSGTLYGTLAGSITSAQLASSLTDETGTGANVFATSPTLVTPLLGTPTSGVMTNVTGLTEAGQTLADNTTNDVSITKHGYAPKAPNDATKFLDGTGAYTKPTGSSGATRSIPMFNFATNPDDSGNVFFERANVIFTTAPWTNLVARFGSAAAAEPTTKLIMSGKFVVPPDYVAGAQIVFNWSATTTTGNVVLGIDYRTTGGNNTTSINTAGIEETVTSTVAGPTTAAFRQVTTLTLTAGNFAVGETVQFNVYRDGSVAGDTMAATLVMFDCRFQYTN